MVWILHTMDAWMDEAAGRMLGGWSSLADSFLSPFFSP